MQFFRQQIISWDPTIGNTLWLGKIKFVDESKPTAPANLVATVNENNVTLTWEASTDNVGITGYIIYQNDVAIDTITKLTYTLENLLDEIYTFGVSAIDKSGNASATTIVEEVVIGTKINNATIVGLEIYPNLLLNF